MGGGVQVGSGVLLGGGVLVGGGGGEGVNVPVGVMVGVQVTILLGTAFLTYVQPLAKLARTPKSELTKPVNGLAQPSSKSISQR